MFKICKYDKNHWLMRDENKNLFLVNEQTNQLYDFEVFVGMVKNCQPERLNPETLEGRQGFFPPPWNICDPENREKTLGWLEFQKEMRRDPKYYLHGCDSLNSTNR